MELPYRSYARHLGSVYGSRVYRIGVDALFSCPNRHSDGTGGCAFCDGRGSSAVYHRTEEHALSRLGFTGDDVACASNVATKSLGERIGLIQSQIERGKAFVKRRYKAQRFSLYFQSYTNTYDSIENLKALFDAALTCGPFVEFIVSTRPDCLSEQVVELLASYTDQVEKVWVEIGLESANQCSLDLLGRNHDTECYIRAVEALHLRSIGVCTHVMLGLPYEGRDDYLATARLVNRVHSDAVKIHNLHVCTGTRLDAWHRQGEVCTASLKRHVSDCIFFLRHLEGSVVIERMMCETPSHRRVSPRSFPDKHQFLEQVTRSMQTHGWVQGDLV